MGIWKHGLLIMLLKIILCSRVVRWKSCFHKWEFSGKILYIEEEGCSYSFDCCYCLKTMFMISRKAEQKYDSLLRRELRGLLLAVSQVLEVRYEEHLLCAGQETKRRARSCMLHKYEWKLFRNVGRNFCQGIKRRILIFLLSSGRYRGGSWFRLKVDIALIWHSLYLPRSWSKARKCRSGYTRNPEHENSKAASIFMWLTRGRLASVVQLWP